MVEASDSSDNTPPPPSVRGLVVDDDPALCDYLGTLLTTMGVETHSAADGREAEHQLRGREYDLLFLDLRLPVMSGELLLELVNQGMLKRPGSIVLMSGAAGVTCPPPQKLAEMGVAGFLAKPFAPMDVRASVEHALGRQVAREVAARAAKAAAETAARPVLVVGEGLWAQALVHVLQRSGGEVLQTVLQSDTFAVMRSRNPSVAVIGPPRRDYDLIHLLAAIRSNPSVGKTALVAALTHEEGATREELMAVGALSVFTVPDALGALSSDVTVRACLSRRTHLRAPLASPVVLHAARGMVGGRAIDLSEGGMGLARLSGRPPEELVRVEFALPGDARTVEVVSAVAWVREAKSAQDGFRAGVRFVEVTGETRARIREYVRQAA